MMKRGKVLGVVCLVFIVTILSVSFVSALSDVGDAVVDFFQDLWGKLLGRDVFYSPGECSETGTDCTDDSGIKTDYCLDDNWLRDYYCETGVGCRYKDTNCQDMGYVGCNGGECYKSDDTCSGIGGEICKEWEECEGEILPAPDGECCIGDCVASSCTDSDGFNKFTKGQTTGSYHGQWGTYYDSCVSNTVVRELYCLASGVIGSKDEACPSGYACKDGACRLPSFPGGTCYVPQGMMMPGPGGYIDSDCLNWGLSENPCLASIPANFYDEAGKSCSVTSYSNCACSETGVSFSSCTTDIKYYTFTPENPAPSSGDTYYNALADVSKCGVCPDNELDGAGIKNSCGGQSGRCGESYLSGALDYRIIDCMAGSCGDMASSTGQFCGMVPEGWTGINSFCEPGDKCYHDDMDDDVTYPDPDCSSSIINSVGEFPNPIITNTRYFGFCNRDFCVDECTEGQTRCGQGSAEGLGVFSRYIQICGEAGDGDACKEWIDSTDCFSQIPSSCGVYGWMEYGECSGGECHSTTAICNWGCDGSGGSCMPECHCTDEDTEHPNGNNPYKPGICQETIENYNIPETCYKDGSNKLIETYCNGIECGSQDYQCESKCIETLGGGFCLKGDETCSEVEGEVCAEGYFCLGDVFATVDTEECCLDGCYDAIPVSECMEITEEGVYGLTNDLSYDGKGHSCIDIQADNVVLDCKNYKIQHIDYNRDDYGIFVGNRENVIIKNCNVEYFYRGIYFVSTDNSKIENSIARNCDYGIYVRSGENNELIDNLAKNNYEGILFERTSKAFMSGNNMEHNYDYNFVINDARYRDYLEEYFDHTILPNNLVQGKKLYYNYNISDYVYDSNTAPDAGAVYCPYCDNIQINNLELNGKCGAGVYFFRTDNSVIDNVIVSYNLYGIFIKESENNEIKGSNINDNDYGVYAGNSYDIGLIDNDVTGSYQGIYLDESSSVFMSGNNMQDNQYNFGIYGWMLESFVGGISHFNHSILTDNLVQGKKIYYNYSIQDYIYDETSAGDAGIVYCPGCDNIQIRNLQLDGKCEDGILFYGTSNSVVENNQISTNLEGIKVYGESANNLIQNNEIFDNQRGIYFYAYGLEGNQLINNFVHDNWWEGINLDGTHNCYMSGNNMQDNDINFDVWGWHNQEYPTDSSFNHQILPDNLVQGKKLYYDFLAQNKIYDETTAPDAGAVYCIGCNNVQIKNLELNGSRTRAGVFFYETDNSVIENNYIRENGNGIEFHGSDNNIIKDNRIELNNWDGINFQLSSENQIIGNIMKNSIYFYLSGDNIIKDNSITENWYGVYLYSDPDGLSQNNLFYNNYFDNNRPVSMYPLPASNTWNTELTTGENIIGGNKIGGNYWAVTESEGFSENCIDANIDGICDSSYLIASENEDFYPLTAGGGTCTETDGGKLFSVKGTATGFNPIEFSEGIADYEDKCVLWYYDKGEKYEEVNECYGRDCYINEKYCDGFVKTETKNCQFGCVDKECNCDIGDRLNSDEEKSYNFEGKEYSVKLYSVDYWTARFDITDSEGISQTWDINEGGYGYLLDGSLISLIDADYQGYVLGEQNAEFCIKVCDASNWLSLNDGQSYNINGKEYLIDLNYMAKNELGGIEIKIKLNNEESILLELGDTYTFSDGSKIEILDTGYWIDEEGNIVGGYIRFCFRAGENVGNNWCSCADIDKNGIVNWGDFSIFAGHWLENNCIESNWCEGADIDKSGSVNWGDFAVFAAHWLDSGCTGESGPYFDFTTNYYHTRTILDTKIKDGDANMDVLYGDESTQQFEGTGKNEYTLLVVSNTNSLFYDGDTDRYFVASRNDEVISVSYLLRVTGFHRDLNLNIDYVTIENVITGNQYTNKKTGDLITIGNVVLIIGEINADEKTVEILAGENVVFNKIYDIEGNYITLPSSDVFPFSQYEFNVYNTLGELQEKWLAFWDEGIGAQVKQIA